MRKLVFLILFYIFYINSYSQIKVEFNPYLLHAYDYDYFEINIQIKNNSADNIILFLQNWRTYLLDRERMIYCMPLMDNYLVNRLYLTKDTINIFKEYIGEEESPLILSDRTFKEIKAKSMYEINVIIEDGRLVEKIKKNNYYLTYLFSYFNEDELKKIFPEYKSYYAEQNSKAILIKRIDIDQEYKCYNYIEKLEKHIDELVTTQKLKEIVKTDMHREKIEIIKNRTWK